MSGVSVGIKRGVLHVLLARQTTKLFISICLHVSGRGDIYSCDKAIKSQIVKL